MDYLSLFTGALSSNSGNVLADMQKIISGFPGGVITSTIRSPDHNKAVGGVPNSQHISGTATDVVMPASEKAAYMKAMRAAGYEVIDEGDHIHAELPPGKTKDEAPPCPSWLPEALCGGWKAVTTPLPSDIFGDTSLGGATKAATGIDPESLMWRITIIIIGLILLALGLAFVLNAPLKKAAIGAVSGIISPGVRDA